MSYKNLNVQKDSKEITYLNKTFGDFKANLIDFAKQYFPDAYNDFNEADPGTMFIEMSSYVGDVLSFYADYLFKENLIQYASEKANVYSISQALGYKPKISVSANVTLDIFQIVPPTGSDDTIAPDYRYGLRLNEDMGVRADNGSEFRTIEPVDFQAISNFSPREASIYSVDSNGTPEYYLLKKSVRASSGEIKEFDFPVTGIQKNFKILLSDENVIGILSVIDSEGNEWTEVNYLAQETTFNEIVNSNTNDPGMSGQSAETPFLLCLKKVPRRFITRVNSENKLELQFGSGISSNPDEEIIPNPDNIGSGLPGSINNLDRAFDPSNFIFTKTYGQAPKDTTFTVKYLVGRGIEDNVGSGAISDIFTSVVNIDTTNLVGSTVDTVKNSLAATNPSPAGGGRSSDTVEDVKNNSLAYFRTQNRAVTKQDYLIRTYSMPPRLGSIAKAWIGRDVQMTSGMGGGSSLTNGSGALDYTVLFDPDLGKEDGPCTPDPLYGWNALEDYQQEAAWTTWEDMGSQGPMPGTQDWITEQIENEGFPMAEDPCITAHPTNTGYGGIDELIEVDNCLSLDLYILGYDNSKRLTKVNSATKQNLQTYLSQYRLLTDAINIKNAFIINIAVFFDIVPLPNFNAREVLLSCVNRLRDHFNIDNWQINQPIILKDLVTLLATTAGVQSVLGNPRIVNKWKTSDGYSGNTYDIELATRNGVIYPSLDPAIFEIKYPDTDIQGKVEPITS